jgi:hypothetical protein
MHSFVGILGSVDASSWNITLWYDLYINSAYALLVQVRGIIPLSVCLSTS